MRTARSVMVLLLLFSASLNGVGQSASKNPKDSVDAVMTVFGRDETILPLPLPWRQSTVIVPDLSPWPPPALYLPPIEPPVGDAIGKASGAVDPLKDVDT